MRMKLLMDSLNRESLDPYRLLPPVIPLFNSTEDNMFRTYNAVPIPL